jgi:hypothetical protein
MTKNLNKLIKIISKTFNINKEFLYLTLKYDLRFYNFLNCACDINVDAKKVCQYLKNNSNKYKINFNN